MARSCYERIIPPSELSTKTITHPSSACRDRANPQLRSTQSAMKRIELTFERLIRNEREAFIPYITAGDPSLDASEQIILELERSGADIIELGVPFSDPMADGPVIQRASERALRNGTSM